MQSNNDAGPGVPPAANVAQDVYRLKDFLHSIFHCDCWAVCLETPFVPVCAIFYAPRTILHFSIPSTRNSGFHGSFCREALFPFLPSRLVRVTFSVHARETFGYINFCLGCARWLCAKDVPVIRVNVEGSNILSRVDCWASWLECGASGKFEVLRRLLELWNYGGE